MLLLDFWFYKSVQLNMYFQMESATAHINGLKSNVTDSRKRLVNIWQEVNRTEEDVAKEQLAATGDVAAPVSNMTRDRTIGLCEFYFPELFIAVLKDRP